MKNDDMKRKIKHAFDSAVPDIKDSVLRAASKEKGKAIMMTNQNNKKKTAKIISGITAAAAVFALLTAGGIHYSSNYVANATVSFDVNPSVELKLSKNQRVLSAEAKNEDGKLILGDMDMENTDIDVAVNALIGSMLQHGYISELANSILITVDGDEATEAELRDKIMAQVQQLLDGQKFGGAVLSQNVEANDELKALAEQYSISVGKAKLISDIVAADQTYAFEDLVNLSINELNLLYGKYDHKNNKIESVGQASDDSYIGEDKALQIALDDLGASESELTELETELDFEHKLMVYEIEFVYNGMEYEYEINAVTGDILEVETDDEDHKYDGKDEIKADITEDQAKKIVFDHAGIDGAKADKVKIELDRDDGVNKYEVEFYVDGVEYEYDINATTGSVIKYKNKDKKEDKDEIVLNGTEIGEDEAKRIAFADANVNEADATDIKVKIDEDDGKLEYDVKFTVADVKYEYEIDAYTGEIVKAEQDNGKDDDEKAITLNGTEIAEDEAKRIAFADANVNEADATDVKVKIDEDDGVIEYEVKFTVADVKYDYDIDAYTGEILDSKQKNVTVESDKA